MKSQKRFSAQGTWNARTAPKLFVEVAGALGLAEEADVRKAAGMLAAKQYVSFLSLTDSWTTQQYGSAAEHAAWNQLACLYKKLPFDDPTIDREAAALTKFHKAEARCHRINQRFRAYANREARPRDATRKPLPYHAQFHRARMWIQKVIGAEPNLPRLLGMSGFCPGTSVGLNGDLTHAAAKLSVPEWPVTPSAAPYAVAALLGDQHVQEYLTGPLYRSDYALDTSTPLILGNEIGLSSAGQYFWPADLADVVTRLIWSRLVMVRHNKIVVVPKTALSGRTIAAEPLLNGYLQKGADEYLRLRLKVAGLDLSSQAANQLMAQAGSDTTRFNPYCTIDLSMASDSLAIELARFLLPPAWFELLFNLRSPEYLLPGEDKPRKYEKFASMGNGFCFPLETLIFASLVVAAYEVTGDNLENNFRVYGDDIVVRQSAALLVLELLRYCGFKPNVDKTFVFGPFRESCGADFFEGVNVRPYYLDKFPKELGDLFGILNGLGRVGLAQEDCWWSLFNEIPPSLRYCRPHSGPDTAITVPRDIFLASKHARWDKHEQRWSWKEILPIAVLDPQLYDPAVEMYGAVRGADATLPRDDKRHRVREKTERAYLPAFAFRRKTRIMSRYN